MRPRTGRGNRYTKNILVLSDKFLLFTFADFLTLASEVLWQAPHRCTIVLLLIFKVGLVEDDSDLDDHT